MITVSIAKLGTSVQDVQVENGASVMVALQSAGYSLDSIVSVKRNGQVVEMDETLNDGDVLLVSQEKIKGGNFVGDELAEKDECSVIRIKFEITENKQETGLVPFLSNQSTFEIVKTYMRSKGVSMNFFKYILDSEGNKVPLSAKLEDGKSYKIVISREYEVSESEEDDE